MIPDRPEVTIAPGVALDLASAAALEREVRRLYANGCDRVVIDLSQVDFVDSTGLRGLLTLRNAAKRNDQSLVLVPGPPGVQRIFTLTGTRGLFDWRD